MKKLVPLVALIFATSTLLSLPASAGTQPRKVWSGWIPYYSMKTALPAAIANVDLVREVMPFWYTLKYNGATKLPVVTDLYAPANPSVPISVPLTSMRNAGFTIIPTITDGTSELVLSKLMANPTSRTQIVNAITNLIMTNNYDGIDLDFEGFAFVDKNTTWSATKPHWIAFVKELSGVLKSKNKLLSVSTPYLYDPAGAQKGYFVYAWADIAPYIDRLRIMTYDYSVSKPGPIGPLAWTERTIKYAVSIMPASKVYVGIPGYGRDWVTKVEGTCPVEVAKVVKVGAKAATFVLRDAAALAQSYGAIPVYNEVFGEVNFTYNKVYSGLTASGLATTCTATRNVWYQDARSFTSRMAFVSKYRLGGLAQWTFGMEDAAGAQAIRDAALAIAPDQVVSTLELNTGSTESAAALEFGSVLGVKATVQLPDKLPINNLLVRIESKSANETTWREIATSTTGVDGTIQVPLLLSKSTIIRVRTDGTWERLESISQEIPVIVNRRISINAPVSVLRNQLFEISGVLSPFQSGVPVQLLQQRAGKWIPVGSPVVTDINGVFTLSATAAQKGFGKYRVSVAKDALWNQVDSNEFTLVIR
uniref:glycosyl hydrolase family 18 protein n=1 Tax=Candidatus Planktophila sp. TaxID=2175601 RepID=UPI00404A9A93